MPVPSQRSVVLVSGLGSVLMKPLQRVAPDKRERGRLCGTGGPGDCATVGVLRTP